MTNDSYRAALETSKRELRKLVDQRDEINRKIMRVQSAILANANMLDDPEETSAELTEMTEITAPTGLTDAVRKTLRDAGRKGLTPVEVRKSLVDSGIDLKGYSNALSTIHTILKRLVNMAEARPAISDGEETIYQWTGADDLEAARQRFIDAYSKVKARQKK